jgi:hypothetical protein
MTDAHDGGGQGHRRQIGVGIALQIRPHWLLSMDEFLPDLRGRDAVTHVRISRLDSF